MPIGLPTPEPHPRLRTSSGDALPNAAFALVGAAIAGALVWTLPPPLVLPAVGVIAIVAAALIALVAWTRAQRIAAAVSCWDLAGALTLIGIVATLLSEPELVIPYLDNQRTE